MTEFIILSRTDISALCNDKPVTVYFPVNIDKKPYVICTDKYFEKQMNHREARIKMTEQYRKEYEAKTIQDRKWIPITERLPEENKIVMASTKNSVYPEARYTKNGWEWAAEYWISIPNSDSVTA